MAADGLVDFSKAKLLDRNWTIKLLLLLQEYKAKRLIDVHKMYFDQSLVLLGRAPAEKIKEAASSVESLLDRIEGLILRRRADTQNRKDYNAYKSMIDQYKQLIGDPNDPKHQAEIDAAVEELRRKNREIPNA